MTSSQSDGDRWTPLDDIGRSEAAVADFLRRVMPAGLQRLAEAADATADALRALAETIERGEAMDDMRVDIEDLPTTRDDDER